MLTCKEVNGLMTDYLEKQVSLTEKILLKIHLWMCENCARNLGQFEKTLHFMKKMKKSSEVPPDLLNRLREIFDQYARCPICEKEVRYFELHRKAEEQLIEIIKRTHPDWAEHSGVCSQCLRYYRQELARQKKT
ncbi:MAG: zf-HC2 domain-containing protein [Deltaproteobacteria bacterium]|nr:zf-HC2 domain-containing protein [Deltaproteobacteria bacterium]